MTPNVSLAAHAAQTIHFHPHLQQTKVSVASSDGVVRLSGEVNSFYEKQLIQESLRAVPGVQLIDNSIQVRVTEQS